MLGVFACDGTPVEADHRRIWQRFAEHFRLLRATPSGLWLADELVNGFGVAERLNAGSAAAEAQAERLPFTLLPSACRSAPARFV